MLKLKRIILFRVPMSICNFRCHYCYLAQRPVHYEGIQPKMMFTPEQVGYALRPERVGGGAYINICADGETLLLKDLDLYVKEMVARGHFVEIVTNMSVTKALDKILELPKEMLSHIEFKCSFHYLELKKRNLLELFADNVKKARQAGASINVEITPSDELVPYVEEVKTFSKEHFGALPHLTIARDDRTEGIDYLTEMDMDEYDKVWGQFDSNFWKFKKGIFGVRQRAFCYAGAWGLYADLTTGDCTACYQPSRIIGNIFANPEVPFPCEPIGKCQLPHCYNGHMLLTLGNIPHHNSTGYGSIRDRVCVDGTHWLQPELREFFDGKLEETNREFSEVKKNYILIVHSLNGVAGRSLSIIKGLSKKSLQAVVHYMKNFNILPPPCNSLYVKDLAVIAIFAFHLVCGMHPGGLFETAIVQIPSPEGRKHSFSNTGMVFDENEVVWYLFSLQTLKSYCH